MNHFATNDAWQREMRDVVLVPWYYSFAFEGRFVLLDGSRTPAERLIQKQAGIDTIVQVRAYNEWTSIQEKIVAFPKNGRPYTAICLETDSCTIPGYESKGWMHYGCADRLLYCFETFEHDLDCLDIDFHALRAWFWPRVTSFRTFRMEEENRTAGCVVPIADIEFGRVPMNRFWLPRQAKQDNEPPTPILRRATA